MDEGNDVPITRASLRCDRGADDRISALAAERAALAPPLSRVPSSHKAKIACVKRALDALASREPYYKAKTWRRMPYEATPYETLDYASSPYVAARDVDANERLDLLDRLRTTVEDGWTDFDGIATNGEFTGVAKSVNEAMKKAKELATTAKTLEPLRRGVDVEERPLWGMDCYTREAILAAISVVEFYAGAEHRSRRVEYLQKWFLPTLHELGDDGWDVIACARAVEAKAYVAKDENVANASQALVQAVEAIDETPKEPGGRSRSRKKSKTAKTSDGTSSADGEAPSSSAKEIAVKENDGDDGDTNAGAESEVPEDVRARRANFRIHPKGTGVVCVNVNGIKAGTFVHYYAGEIYSPWRWYERQDAIKKCFPNMELPSFFNITLERPEHDERGRHTLFVEAMHKGSFASRLSHSCEPNCQTVTFAKDGRLALGMFTTHDVAYGEELTWDYSCITESAEEYRNAFCLCSTPGCRGSFLTYSGSRAFTAVMKKKHGFLHRNAVLLKACSVPLTKNDRNALHTSGIRECALANCPDWLVKWAALTLEYIRTEEKELPQELIDLPKSDLGSYDKIGAEHETVGVVATRFTNLVVTLDKIRHVLSAPGQSQEPFFRILSDEEIIDHLWSGSQSIFQRFKTTLLATEGSLRPEKSKSRGGSSKLAFSEGTSSEMKALLQRIQACESTCKRPASSAEARSLLLEVSSVLRTSGAKHGRAADCLWFYGNTINWFTSDEKFETVFSAPVDITDVAMDNPSLRKVPSAFKGKKENMLQKKYNKSYSWGQLVTWFKQTIYAPDASLSADRRGTLSLPDPESAYCDNGVQYVASERKSLLNFLRNGMDAQWPTTTMWSFKNPSKTYGSPMFDEALRQCYPKEYTSKNHKTFATVLDELQSFIKR